jgi:uncharacterized membrane protein YebE (DUF533 family)
MKAKLLVPFILFLTVAVINANGQTIHKQARHERQRIAQGERSGELTKHETSKLVKEQKDIHKDMREAKKDDGHIDRRERKEIWKDERKASRDIYRAKHNNRKKA